MFKGCIMLVLCMLLAGCTTSPSSSYGGAYAYQQNTYAQNTTYRPQSVRYVGGPLDNTGNSTYQTVTPSYSATSRSEVGSAFSKKLATMKAKQAAAEKAAQEKARQQTLKDRERRITEFLWKNEIPGVSDTRVLLKNTITEADKRLKNLANDLRLAGKTPESDSAYVEILNKRNRLRSHLTALDNKIMSAIVAKSAGSAAEAVSFSATESAEMATAKANLQSAATQYRNDTEQIIRSSNW